MTTPAVQSTFLHWQHPGTATGNATFMFAWGMGDSTGDPADETVSQILVEQDGTIDHLTCASDSAIGGAETVAFKLRKNGVDTTLTATIGNSAASAQDNTHSFTVVRGDLLSVSLAFTGTPGKTLTASVRLC